jgi:hypothetical protein
MTPDKVFPLARSGNKPSGNKGIKRDQQSENYARVPAHVVLANIEGLVVDGMVIDQRDQAEPRSALALIKVTNAVVDGVTTATTAEPILDSGSRNVTLGRVTNFAVPAAP